ncbi:MAG: AsnC family transcriptional regulator [Candidatus Bathyarchaeota archaeon]|nr:AsnC family transcriptional regulator [Candidatus Bathyarchaeota archaeon]
MSKRLDKVDKILISELQKDGRTALTDIGKKTGISHVAIRKRLGKLRDKGLLNISACLNPQTLDMKIAVINVEVENSQRLKELMELFKNCPRTVFLSGLSASNLLTVIVGEDFSTLESVIGTCSPRVQKGVRRSEVSIGSFPIHPEFLCIRVLPNKNSETAPCGAKCDKCEKYRNKQCLACPTTKFYRGPL